MNYIILNGVRSTTIRGLLIQSLPPISKPLMRTQVEEIDGRDGDIITSLGFSAYNKQITIGLRGQYDVDEVIAYFNSQGTVTFSNEIDKYYNYKIIEQLNLERLIRYRTATVTFHVQPFKFSAVERALELDVDNQFLALPDYNKAINGLAITVLDGVIQVTGTSTAATEIYIPAKTETFKELWYRFVVSTSGTGADGCRVRLIRDMPIDIRSFGGEALTLTDGKTSSIRQKMVGSEWYNYIYLFIPSNVKANFLLSAQVTAESNLIEIENNGNIISRPRVTLYGTGAVVLSVNGKQILEVNIGMDEYITIDSANLEAYKGDALKNRQVKGDYDAFFFGVGTNKISWTGTLKKMFVENYSRWL